MICLEDRIVLARNIREAHQAGARLHLACQEAGIDVRTYQRWNGCHGLTLGDKRPTANRPRPAHALSAQERAHLLAVANVIDLFSRKIIGADTTTPTLKRCFGWPSPGPSTTLGADPANPQLGLAGFGHAQSGAQGDRGGRTGARTC